MPLSQATQALFDSSSVGDGLLTALHLPTETFPRAGTWNQFPSLTNEAQAHLARDSFHSQPTVPNKTHLARTSTMSLEQQFVHLNGSAIRFSPAHRLWSTADLFALPQRLDTGCHLLVIRMMASPNSSSTSEPFICFAGPMATPLSGASSQTASL